MLNAVEVAEAVQVVEVAAEVAVGLVAAHQEVQAVDLVEELVALVDALPTMGPLEPEIARGSYGEGQTTTQGLLLSLQLAVYTQKDMGINAQVGVLYMVDVGQSKNVRSLNGGTPLISSPLLWVLDYYSFSTNLEMNFVQAADEASDFGSSFLFKIGS